MIGFIKGLFGAQGYQTLSEQEFANKIKTAQKPFILDVRSKTEFADGKLHNAFNIDVRRPDFIDKIAALDKDRTYLVYCQTGPRSRKACKMLVKSGFKNVYNLKGGFVAWSGRVV